jgi:uncharacterized protein with PQ loop repeat
MWFRNGSGFADNLVRVCEGVMCVVEKVSCNVLTHQRIFLAIAPIFSIVVFCAPIPTLRQVSRDQTVGNLPLLPYSSMMASASLWVVYGILKSEPKIWSANGTIHVALQHDND